MGIFWFSRRAGAWIALATAFLFLAGCSPKSKATPVQPTRSPDELVAIATIFVDRMAKGDFAGATRDFNERMKIAAPPDSLKQIWDELVAKVGAFQQQTAANLTTEQGSQVVYVLCQFEKASLNIRVTFDAQGQIRRMQFVQSLPSATGTP